MQWMKEFRSAYPSLYIYYPEFQLFEYDPVEQTLNTLSRYIETLNDMLEHSFNSNRSFVMIVQPIRFSTYHV